MNVNRSFLHALLFVKSNFYVNTARINPNDLFVDNFLPILYTKSALPLWNKTSDMMFQCGVSLMLLWVCSVHMGFPLSCVAKVKVMHGKPVCFK